MAEQFTPLYEWLADFPKISLNEALLISRVKMWGQRGCFESSARLAKKLKLNRRTVVRTLGQCLIKDYLLVLRESKRRRTLYFNYDFFTPDIMKASARLAPVDPPDSDTESLATAGGSDRESPVGDTESPLSDRESLALVTESHPTISSETSTKKTRQLFENFAEVMTTQPDISRSTQMANRLAAIQAQAKQLKTEEAQDATNEP